MNQANRFCQRCGTEIIPGSRFCNQCGQALHYCHYCGTALDPEARFCSQCGQPLPAQPGPAPAAVRPPVPATPPSVAPIIAPPSATSTEPVLGVIPHVEERAGMFRVNTYNLVFSSQRMVLATVTDRMMQRAAREAAEEAKRQGQGFLARMGAIMHSRQALWQRYLSMPVEAILAEHADNTFLPLSHIRQVRFEQDDDEDKPVDRLVLRTTSGKREFTLKGGNAGEARELLRRVLGDLVR